MTCHIRIGSLNHEKVTVTVGYGEGVELDNADATALEMEEAPTEEALLSRAAEIGAAALKCALPRADENERARENSPARGGCALVVRALGGRARGAIPARDGDSLARAFSLSFVVKVCDTPTIPPDPRRRANVSLAIEFRRPLVFFREVRGRARRDPVRVVRRDRRVLGGVAPDHVCAARAGLLPRGS